MIEDALAFLGERPIAVIATVGPDGFAHAVAVEVVVHDGAPHVWCESWSVKARNAQREGRATISAYKSNEGVMVRGSVSAIRNGDPGYLQIVELFLSKYKEENYGNDLILRIEAQRVTRWGDK